MMHYVAVRQWKRAGISGPRPLAPEKVHDPVVFCTVRSPSQHLWIMYGKYSLTFLNLFYENHLIF